MKQIKQQALGLLLTLAVLAGLLPTGVWAAVQPAQIQVTITVYQQGIFATDRQGQAVRQRTVSASDRNADGTITLDEALYALHAQYALGGQEDYKTQSGAVARLWGDESGAFGFYRNNALTGAVTEQVLDHGDDITAFIYKDQTNWTDRYTYFDQKALTVCVNQEFALELMYAGYDEGWNPVVKPQPTAPIGVSDQAGSYGACDVLKGEHLINTIYAKPSTDNNGVAKLTFTAPGVYLVTAQHDSSNYTDYTNTPPQYYLVPPISTVTVLSEQDYAQYQSTQQYLDLARELLTWDKIKGENTLSYALTKDLAIVSTLTAAGETVDVSWVCTDTTGALSVSNYYGAWGAYVDRPAAQDVSCTLTATLNYDGASVTKQFPVTIRAEGVSADKESVVTYAQLLGGIAASYTSSTNPWVVLGMKGYNGQNTKGGTYTPSSVATTALADTAIGVSVSGDTLDGVDISGAYAIYTIPYLSLAYGAAGIDHPQRLADMKTAMVNALKGINQSSGVDDIAPVMTALAPYYLAGDAQVVQAMNTALTWLAGQQTTDGAFAYYGTANTNSTALAVVALSALGIDCHTDTRFIKNHKSAMDGLFSFALANHSGFGYKGNVTGNDLSTEQGFRALVAYARMKQIGGAYNIYLQAKNSVGVVPAPNITTTQKPPAGGGETKEVEITVSVMIPPEGGQEGQYTYRQHKSMYTNLLGQATHITVSSKTPAIQVTTDILDAAGLSYSVSGGYFSRVGTLSEGDHGPNSGWQYLVNAQAPMESSASFVFDRNSTLVWYYTDDYTKEASAQSWTPQPPQLPAPKVEAKGDGSYAVTLPANQQGNALVTIESVGKGQVVVIVKKDGTEQVIAKSMIQNGTAYLLLEEDAVVRVVDGAAQFSDVPAGAWYTQAVGFVSSHGLFSGVAQDQFDAEGRLNRGMMVTVLHALEQEAPKQRQPDFSDVSAQDWYAPGAAWAKELGLSVGDQQGRFHPLAPITREQLALMLYQYATQLGMKVEVKTDLRDYQDGTLVSPWAMQAMSWAVEQGIITGGPDANLNPGGTATRAEASVMLQQFVQRLLLP